MTDTPTAALPARWLTATTTQRLSQEITRLVVPAIAPMPGLERTAPFALLALIAGNRTAAHVSMAGMATRSAPRSARLRTAAVTQHLSVAHTHPVAAATAAMRGRVHHVMSALMA